MNIKETLQADLKTSMLARDSATTDVIKSLKSAIQYAEVASNKNNEALSEEEIISVIKKESKKRQDSVDMYTEGGREESAEKERQEKLIIDRYLPSQLDESAINDLIDSSLTELSILEPSNQDMGKIMSAVKSKAGNTVDGSLLAKLVKQRIAS